MHELSIVLGIIDVVLEEARRHEGRITAIHLKLGPLSGVVKEAVLFNFDLAREDTTLAQTKLVIEEMPIIARCSLCGSERTLNLGEDLRCPACPDAMPEIISGRELEVFALEIEP